MSECRATVVLSQSVVFDDESGCIDVSLKLKEHSQEVGTLLLGKCGHLVLVFVGVICGVRIAHRFRQVWNTARTS